MKCTSDIRIHLGLLIALMAVPLLGQTSTTKAPSESAQKPETPNAEVGIAGRADAPADRKSYVIGRDDVLAISVWKEPDLTRSVPVRSDGKISLPLVGEIEAAGHTPAALEIELTQRLRAYMQDPEVAVIVEQMNSKKFNILGEVTKPGSYSLTGVSTVMDAIAIAGGFRDFAKRKDVYVLRQNPDGSQSKLPFNYKDFIKGKNPAQNIKLQPHDTVIVP